MPSNWAMELVYDRRSVWSSPEFGFLEAFPTGVFSDPKSQVREVRF
jgi:hypothetical protein